MESKSRVFCFIKVFSEKYPHTSHIPRSKTSHSSNNRSIFSCTCTVPFLLPVLSGDASQWRGLPAPFLPLVDSVCSSSISIASSISATRRSPSLLLSHRTLATFIIGLRLGDTLYGRYFYPLHLSLIEVVIAIYQLPLPIAKHNQAIDQTIEKIPVV